MQRCRPDLLYAEIEDTGVLSDMKKIIFFIGSMSRGGAERVISILANHYAEKGWNVSIVMLLRPDTGYALNSRIQLRDMTGNTSSRIKRIPYWIKNIRGLVRNEDPDVIVSFVARINVLVQTACAGLKKKLIVSERNDPRRDGRGKIMDLFTWLLYPEADRVVFQSKEARAYFCKRIQKKSVIIYNPVQVEEQAAAVTMKKIVTAGRLEPQKNHMLLIHAFRRVLAKFPEYELWIYGDGYLKKQLYEETVRLGIKGQVFFPGNVTDLHQQIADAEVFVLSSDYEGLSNALLEAMMMGIPCVSAECAGSREVIQDGNNGLLARSGDEASLADAVCSLLADKELSARISENARISSKKFSSENVLTQWDKIIEQQRQ